MSETPGMGTSGPSSSSMNPTRRRQAKPELASNAVSQLGVDDHPRGRSVNVRLRNNNLVKRLNNPRVVLVLVVVVVFVALSLNMYGSHPEIAVEEVKDPTNLRGSNSQPIPKLDTITAPTHTVKSCLNKENARNRQRLDDFGFDRLNQWKPPSVDAKTTDPFAAAAAGLGKFDTVVTPCRRFSKTRGMHIAGGLTADMGWVLTVARYALTNFETGHEEPTRTFRFPEYWGHGCLKSDWERPEFNPDQVADRGRWTCFFKEVGGTGEWPKSMERMDMFESNPSHRHAAKMKVVYSGTEPEARARRNQVVSYVINRHATPEEARQAPMLSDVNTMRYIFKWVFQLQDHVRTLVDNHKRSVQHTLAGRRYVSMHIRWGDKIGVKEGPREGSFVPIERYIDLMNCFYELKGEAPPKTILVGTDDYNAILELRKQLGGEYTVLSTQSADADGFSIVSYNTIPDVEKVFEQTVAMWADLELMGSGEVFVGSFESSVPRMVHLMRLDKDPKTTINVVVSSRACDTENVWGQNYFWNCES